MAGSLYLEERRNTCIDTLATAWAEDVITEAEFEQRVELVNRAESVRELASILSDLPPRFRAGFTDDIARPGRSQDRQPDRYRAGSPVPSSDEGARVVAILSERNVKGNWLTDDEVNANCVLGSMRLDFREIDDRDFIHLNCLNVLGELQIIVPPDMRVDNYLNGVISEVTHKYRSRITVDQPRTLRITGTSVLGSVTIRTRDL